MDKLAIFDKLTALSISIGVLSGVATFLAVGPASGFFFIWAATIAWAAYFFLGATKEALINTIVCGIFGVVMAWFTAILLTSCLNSRVPPFFLNWLTSSSEKLCIPLSG